MQTSLEIQAGAELGHSLKRSLDFQLPPIDHRDRPASRDPAPVRTDLRIGPTLSDSDPIGEYPRLIFYLFNPNTEKLVYSEFLGNLDTGSTNKYCCYI